MLLAASVSMFGQFQNPVNGQPVANNISNTTAIRSAFTGIGPAWPNFTPNSLFQVRALPGGLFNQIAQIEQGTFGQFDPNNRWLGLGLGNPGGPGVSPYGLAIVDNTNLGFYNLIIENNRNNLIAGFGVNGVTNNNRFIIRSYFGTNGTSSKDILTVDPDGSVGVNTGANQEPESSFSVDATGALGTPLPASISIKNKLSLAIPTSQNFTSVGAATAIGAQANQSLSTTGIAVEGLRAQIPDFAALAPPNLLTGVATNLQVVKNPFGTGANFPFITAIDAGNEYAELTWQDIDYNGVTTRDCNILPINTAQALDKFYISFRNNQNVDPFSVNNKLPVATFQGNGRVGIGTVQPTSGVCGGTEILLDVNGWIKSNGALTASDLRFKQNIKPVNNSLELLRKLNAKTYNFNTEAFPDRNFGNGLRYGYIAQELEKVIPEATVLNSDGFYYVDYLALVPILSEAIKEQDKTLTEQQAEIARLEAELQEIRNMVMEIKSADKEVLNTGYRLEQNNPNPFGNSTVVNYSLPEGTNGASINVYDLNGRLLKSFQLKDIKGNVDIDSDDLGSGIYLYDLLVNGRQIDVKRMVVSKMD